MEKFGNSVDDADIMPVFSDNCWIHLDELFMDLEIDRVPNDRGESIVPGFADSHTGYSVLDTDETADVMNYFGQLVIEQRR